MGHRTGSQAVSSSNEGSVALTVKTWLACPREEKGEPLWGGELTAAAGKVGKHSFHRGGIRHFFLFPKWS